MARGARAKSLRMSLTKATLREQLRAEAAQHTSEERRKGSQAICARLEQQPAWHNARNVLAFMPLEQEPDLTALLEQCLATGKTLALPRFDSRTGGYQAAHVTDLTTQLI